MRAAIYARYSSDAQREESIDAQVRACNYYCTREGLEVVATYADRAKSGMYHAELRTEYTAMLAAADRGTFDVIVVHSLSRFGRNTSRALDDIARLRAHGVRVVSVRETLEQTPEGQLMLTIIAGMNEYFSLNLAKEVRKGQTENVYQGKSTGGRPCFGYELDADLHYRVVPREADGVRLIFSRYLEGYGYTEIARELGAMGLKTRHGRPFGSNSIYSILTNQRYVGNAYYGRQKNRNGARGPRQTEDVLVVEGVCPAIITRHTWEEAQAKLKERKSHAVSTKSTEVYLLTGKLYCGLCGSKMVGGSRKNRAGDRYRYYICNRQDRTRDCDMPSVRKDKLEAAVLARIAELFDGVAAVDTLAQQLVDSQAGHGAGRAQVERDLAAVDRKISNVLELLIDDDGPARARLKAKLAELEHDRSVLVDALAEAMVEPELTLEAAREYVSRMVGLTTLTPELQRQVILSCVDRITVWPVDGGTGKRRGKEQDFRVEVVLSPDAGESKKPSATGAEGVHGTGAELSAPNHAHPLVVHGRVCFSFLLCGKVR